MVPNAFGRLVNTGRTMFSGCYLIYGVFQIFVHPSKCATQRLFSCLLKNWEKTSFTRIRLHIDLDPNE